ncbi:patatin [Pseudoxanthomonas kalamensis DSM 18571]|uniref:patatin-like phospholipase family protein n=1 Tax=Pseudoxanthomonas kalamensis TaxID=289483 RepID=UPI001391EEAE|nr:patatin-like phospholipase family protein [Pseudoxanthomonas kalamensis]KAF1710353.1 patatin [Pseudoxanthomonas kalamensis DSM 18571]
MSASQRPTVALALGGGSARGWAHIGVIRALEEAGMRIDMVCGTSIGALVGAVYATGELDRFEQWVLELGLREVASFLDVGFGGGLLKGEKLMAFFEQQYQDRPIEELDIPFAAVATSLRTGAEVWLRSGSTLRAVRASIALPGLFTPVIHGDTILVDGGLVNPVPVSLARAMEADVVIAVDLSSDMLGRNLQQSRVQEAPPPEERDDWWGKLQGRLAAMRPPSSNHGRDQPRVPDLLNVLASSINIMQVRIARSRMAGDPPELIVAPRLAHMGLYDFHRAKEAIEEGRNAVARVAYNIEALVERTR